MAEITKPNDMFIASLSAPQAQLTDFLANGLKADNTALLTPDEYKATPFVKKRYTNADGVFNDVDFAKDYKKAYENYTNLSLHEAEMNLADYLEYSPSDRFAPVNGKTLNTAVSYKSVRNPFQKSYSVQGINTISDSTLTAKEVAQGNYIWDPKTKKFTDKTPETLNIWDKTVGETLVYAKYDHDGEQENPVTGEVGMHYAGEFIEDQNGNYFTEFAGDKDLLNKEVVALSDILTKEGSTINKYDFFDSDGQDKSAFGVAMKTLVTLAPYAIPYVGPYYAALTTTFGLASVMPTFWKAIDNAFINKEDLNPTATKLENWFKKFDSSRSEAGQGFFTLEGIGGLVADTFGQLYQQRAAANAAKWFLDRTAKLGKLSKDATQAEKVAWQLKSLELAKQQNKWQSAAALGYMGLVSTADIYNETLNAGYDRQTAGIAALASAGALFGIMNFNETARGIGTWFLNKSTGFNKEIESGVVKKLALEQLDVMAEGVNKMRQGNSKVLADTLFNFKNKVNRSLYEVFTIGGEEYWKNMMVEGVEEVTEEIVQDAIKGIVDTCHWLGWVEREDNSQGFGGWNNVFSQQGMQRYLETLVGGALGGGLFVGVDKLDRRFKGTKQEKALNYTLQDAIHDGRINEVVETVKAIAPKFFNSRQSASLGNFDGEEIYLSTAPGGKSQADILTDLATKHIAEQVLAMTAEYRDFKMDPTAGMVSKELSDAYVQSNFDSKYVMANWKKLVDEICDLKQQINDRQTIIDANEAGTDIKTAKTELEKLTKQLKTKRDELENWHSGEKFADFTQDALLYLNKNLRSKFLNLDVSSFAKHLFNVNNFSDLAADSQQKQEIEQAYRKYKEDLTEANMLEVLPQLREVVKKTIPVIGQYFQDFVNNENNKLWLKRSWHINDRGEIQWNELQGPDTNATLPLIQYLENNPKYWTLSGKLKYDLASQLEDSGVIDFGDYSNDEKAVIKQYINDLAAHTNVNMWTAANVNNLLYDINNALTSGNSEDQYIKQIQQIRSQNPEDGVEPDLTLSTLNWHIDKLSPLAQSIKLKTVLDAISEDDAFVDEELYHILQTAFQQEQQELLREKLLEFVKTPFRGNDNELRTFLQLLQENAFNRGIQFVNNAGNVIAIKSEASFEGISENNIAEYKDKFKQLVKDLTTVTLSTTEGTTNIEIQNFNPVDWMSNTPFFTDLNQLVEPFDENLGTEGVLPLLNEIISTLDSEGILPEELQQKWNIIEQKASIEHPMLTGIRSFFNLTGLKNLSVIDWLFKKESEIRDNQNFDLTSVDEEVLNEIDNGLDFIEGLIQAMTESGVSIKDLYATDADTALPISFNGVLRNFYNLTDQKQKAEQYKVFGTNEALAMSQVILDLKDKLNIIRELNLEATRRVQEQDNKNRKNYSVNLAKKLDELNSRKLILNGKDFSLVSMAVRYDADVEDTDGSGADSYVIQALHDTHIRLQSLLSEVTSQEEKNEILHAYVDELLKIFNHSDNNDGLLKDYITENSISDFLVFEAFLQAACIDQITLNEKYCQGLTDKGLSPVLDQELEVKDLIAKSLNQDLYAYAVQKIDELKTINQPTVQPRAKGYRLTRVSGSAGSGKSKTMDILLSALIPKKVIFTAPTQDKVSDLKTNISLKEESVILNENDEFSIFEQIFGKKVESLLNSFEESVQNSITNLKQSKGEFTFSPYNIKYTVTKSGDLISNVIINDLGTLKLDDLLDLSQLSSTIDKDTVIVADEITNTNALFISLLEAIAEKTGANIITLGDDAQIGQYFTSGNVKYSGFNVQRYAMHRTPALSGTLRCKNTGKKLSTKVCGDISLKYAQDVLTEVIDNEVTQRGYDEAKDAPIIKNYYKQNSHSLIYKGLMGDRIVNTQSQFNEVVNQLAPLVNSGEKSLMIIVDNEEAKKEISALLNSTNLDSTKYTGSVLKTLKQAHGAEADFTIIYNLSTQSPEKNGDVDTHSIYTAITRSKEFSLVYETSDQNLFSVWGIQSKEDSSIAETGSNTEANTELANNRIAQLQSIISQLESLTNQEQTEKEQPAKIDVAVESKQEKVENGESALPNMELPTGNTQDQKNEEEQNDDTPEKIKRYHAVYKEAVGEDDFKESVRIYGYYNRVGLSPENIALIKQQETQDDLNGFMQSLWGVSPENEKYRDLLGFWYYNQQNISSGQDLLDQFLSLKNQILYNQKTGQYKIQEDWVVNFKTRTDEDFSYLKPNDDPAKDGTYITTLLKPVIYNGNIFYITIIRCGYNETTQTNFASSNQLDALQKKSLKLIDSTGVSSVFYKLSKKSTLSAEQLDKAKKYLELRGVPASKFEDILKNVVDGLIPMTGLQDWDIDSNSESNAQYNNGEKLKYNRLTIAQLRQLGLIVTQITDSATLTNDQTIELLNETRFENLESANISSGLRIRIKPLGCENLPNQYSGVLLTNKIKDATVLEGLSKSQQNATQYSQYAFRQLLSYLQYYYNLKKLPEGLSATIYQFNKATGTGTKHSNRQQAWLSYIQDIITELQDKDVKEPNDTTKAIIAWLKSEDSGVTWYLKNRLAASNMSTPTKLVENLNLQPFVKVKEFFNSKESVGYLFDYASTDYDDTSVVTKVFENTSGFFNFNNYDISTDPIRLDVVEGAPVETPVQQITETQPESQETKKVEESQQSMQIDITINPDGTVSGTPVRVTKTNINEICSALAPKISNVDANKSVNDIITSLDNAGLLTFATRKLQFKMEEIFEKEYKNCGRTL